MHLAFILASTIIKLTHTQIFQLSLCTKKSKEKTKEKKVNKMKTKLNKGKELSWHYETNSKQMPKICQHLVVLTIRARFYISFFFCFFFDIIIRYLKFNDPINSNSMPFRVYLRRKCSFLFLKLERETFDQKWIYPCSRTPWW